MSSQWTLEEAEARLPELINAAAQGEPQFICNAEHRKAVVISPETWENAVCHGKPSFKDLLFAIPKGEPFIDEKGRDELNLRDVEF